MAHATIIPCPRGLQGAWMWDVVKEGMLVVGAPSEVAAKQQLERLEASNWRYLCVNPRFADRPVDAIRRVLAERWTLNDLASIESYVGRGETRFAPMWRFSGGVAEHAFIFDFWIFDQAIVEEIRALVPEIQFKNHPTQELPDFATHFDDAEKFNRPVQSVLVEFFPATEARPEPMRVSYRIADKNAWWYEVECYNVKHQRWIELKTHSDRVTARTDARNWYPEVPKA